MHDGSTSLTRLLKGVLISSVLVGMAAMQTALAQDTQTEDEGADVSTTGEAYAEPVDGALEEVVIKGFRKSLEAALDLKRDAVNERDSIVADDIGKMPDLNLAEAIQRVPGVAITRESGEGRQVTLRGLGPDFTQVTLNGMEVPSSTGGLDSFGGVNRGRAFDFNVFSAELFNRIDINKTSLASIEEGGIAGSVQLYTARPLDNPGFHASAYGQIGYNDLSEAWDPKATAFISTTNDAETVGFLLTAAYTERTVHQDGFGTVRWAEPDGGGFGGNNTTLSDEQLNSLWYPRLPRQDSFHHTQDRLGISAALQFRPNDDLEFGLNWVYSHYEATTDSYNSFAEFRRSGPWGYPTITANSVTLDPNGDYVVAGNFDNVGLRTESRQNADDTDFNQVTADMRWNINDSFTMTGMIGTAKSKFEDDYFRVNIETPVGTNFSYDFTGDPNVAAINYDIDVSDPSNFEILTNDTIRQFGVDRTNDTVRLDFVWDLNDSNVVNFGGIYNDREVDSTQANCASCVDQTDIVGLGEVFTYDDAGGFGSGTELDFWVLNFARAKAAYGLDSFELARGTGNQTWNVKEKTAGAYVDYNLITELAGHGFRLNAGVRYVDTKVTAVGWVNSDISITEKNDYDNWLPSLNIAFDATDEIVLRAAASRTMTRASLSSLAPSKSYSDVNFSVSGGNSQLDPLVSDNIDLSASWYFAEQAVISVAWYHKDIDSFISSPSTEEPLRLVDYPAVASVYPDQPQLLDPSLIWTYSTSANTDGTKLDGWEIAYQQAFTGLPGFWGNFGFIGNYSWVDATTEVIRNGVTVTVPLEGLSKHSWNATLYYEVPTWGIRVAVNNRDDYITDNTGSNGNISHGTTGPTHIDLSAFYNFTEEWSVTLEAINLTDEYERLYTTGDGTLNLVREYNHTGRQYYLGLRYQF